MASINNTFLIIFIIENFSRDAHELSRGVLLVSFVVIEILLSSFDFPLLIRSLIIELFKAYVFGTSRDEPVRSQDSTAGDTVATEATVALIREIQISLICIR